MKYNRIKLILLSTLICFIILTAVSIFFMNIDINHKKKNFSYTAENEATYITSTIVNVMERINTLRVLVIDHGGNTDFFYNVADDIYTNVKAETGITLKNVAIAPGGIVEKVYPLEGNESLVGFNFLDTTRPGNAEAIEAYENNLTVLTNPFNLVQGGVGMAGRSPVIINERSSDRLWGLVTVTIDFDDLIRVLHLDNLNRMGMNYSLSCVDPDGNTTILHSSGSCGNDPVKTRFEIRNLTWELMVAPYDGWIPSWMIAIHMIMVAAVSLIIGILANTVFLRLGSLEEEAMFDRLTGFLNKFRGTERVAKLCRRKTGALMIMDLDSFKLVNDLYGHDMGDKVLKAFADVIRKNTRETDTVSRIGGDEFLAFYEDLSDENAVASITLRLNTQFIEKVRLLLGKNHDIPIGISIGVAMVREKGREYDELFALADSALYSVKQNGKHGYCIASEDTEAGDAKDADPEGRLERMIRIADERNDNGGTLLLGIDSFPIVYRFITRFHKKYGGTVVFLLFNLSSGNSANNIQLLDASARFSAILQRALEESDIIIQKGPDSFLVILTGHTRSEADETIQRIEAAWDAEGNGDAVMIEYALKTAGEQQPPT